MSSINAPIPERAAPALHEIQRGMALHKCRKCGCMKDALDTASRAFRNAEEPEIREILPTIEGHQAAIRPPLKRYRRLDNEIEDQCHDGFRYCETGDCDDFLTAASHPFLQLQSLRQNNDEGGDNPLQPSQGKRQVSVSGTVQ